MIPTEHEGTVALDAASRKYIDTHAAAAEHFEDKAPTWDELDRIQQNNVRQLLLPYVWAALEALPDRRRAAWEEGREAGEVYKDAQWHWSSGEISRAVNGLKERPERPANPYPEEAL